VVIGIIAILISLLLPALAKVKESGNRIACASNLHQLAVATIMYINDNHQIFPRGGRINYIANGQGGWSSAAINTAGYNSADDMIYLEEHYLGYSHLIHVNSSPTDYTVPALCPTTLTVMVLKCPSNDNIEPGPAIWYWFYPL